MTEKSIGHQGTPTASKCEVCKFYENSQELTTSFAIDDFVGFCKRNAPNTRTEMLGDWPIVSASDWCGEYSMTNEESKRLYMIEAKLKYEFNRGIQNER